jgi:hypothetical protein
MADLHAFMAVVVPLAVIGFFVGVFIGFTDPPDDKK